MSARVSAHSHDGSGRPPANTSGCLPGPPERPHEQNDVFEVYYRLLYQGSVVDLLSYRDAVFAAEIPARRATTPGHRAERRRGNPDFTTGDRDRGRQGSRRSARGVVGRRGRGHHYPPDLRTRVIAYAAALRREASRPALTSAPSRSARAASWMSLPEGSRAKVIALSRERPTIAKRPGVCGGRACIAGTRITVWGLVVYRRQGLDEQAILDAIPHLSPEELAVALRYAEENPEEIARDIAENEEGG